MNAAQVLHGIALGLNGALHTLRMLRELGAEKEQLRSLLVTAMEEERDISSAEVLNTLATSQNAIDALREAAERTAEEGERDGAS